MIDLDINWSPLVRRDLEGFRKLSLEIEDPSAREKALLKAGGLIDVDLYRFGSDHLRSYTSLKEAELGTNNQDTHRLYRGEDIDGRET